MRFLRPCCYFATEKPESATAFSRSACFALLSSYLTVTWPFSRSAEADWTPGTAFNLASVFPGHLSHFQPLTLIVSVCVAASAAVLKPRAIAKTIALFMAPPSRGTATQLCCRRPLCQHPRISDERRPRAVSSACAPCSRACNEAPEWCLATKTGRISCADWRRSFAEDRIARSR